MEGRYGVTDLNELLNGGVDDHEGVLDQVDHAVPHGDVGLDDLGEDRGARVRLVPHQRVRFNVVCGMVFCLYITVVIFAVSFGIEGKGI